MNNRNLCTGLLACSVILNAFLAGYLLSSHSRPHGGPMMPPSPLGQMERAADHLDARYKDDVTKIINDNQSKLDKDMGEMENIFQQIHPILTAEKFDAAKLKKLHAKLSAQDEKVKDAMLSLLTQIAAKLPDAERIRFFNESNPDHGPGHFRGPPPPEDFHD